MATSPGDRARSAPAGRAFATAGLVVLVTVAAAVAIHRSLPGGPPHPSRTGGARPAVAVLGLLDLSGGVETAWLSTALAELLTVEIGAGDALRVVPGAVVARVRSDLALPDATTLRRDLLDKVRRQLDVDFVVLGSYRSGAGGRGPLSLDVRLLDAAAGSTLAVIAETSPQGDVSGLVARTAERVRQALGAASAPTGEAGRLRALLSSNAAALKPYSEGLTRLRLFDALAARALLEQAAAASPESPQIHAALGEAWSILGYDGHAQEEARRAHDLAASLPREERLLFDAMYRETTREWDTAIETYRSLWELHPDDPENALRLAQAQARAGWAQESLTTLDQLRRVRPSADPRVDVVEALTANMLGDFQRAKAAAERAAQHGDEVGARLLVARARLLEVYALRGLGEPSRAVAAGEEARRLYEAAGDRGGVARALVETAGVLRYVGDLARTRALAEEALDLARKIGHRTVEAQALNRLGSVLEVQGRLAEAKKTFESALAVYREVGDRDWEATALNNVALTLWRHGTLGAAHEQLEKAQALFRAIGDKHGIAFTEFNLGFVELDRGDLEAARGRFESALTLSRDIREDSLIAVSLAGLGDTLAAQGDLDQARSRHDEALGIRRRLGETGRAAESQASVAAVALASGQAAAAEADARAAAAELERQGAAPAQAQALAVLSAALLAQGRTQAAAEAAERALALPIGEYRALRLGVAVARARAQAAAGRRADARRALDAAVAEAHGIGLAGLELDATLALAEVEIALDPPAARARVDALAADARARGYGLVALKAEELRRTPRPEPAA